MTFILWCIIIGTVLIITAIVESLVKRLPLSTAIIYLVIGLGLGPLGIGFIQLDPLTQSALLERLTEIAVLVSLFTSGLKLRTPLTDPLWWLPVRLAFGSMLITVALVTLVGVVWLKLPLGAAIVLGAILAPTDPVLASDVQTENALDKDRLRFSLTGEASLNDGSCFPFILLGLGLLGLEDLGTWGWHWLLVDVLWGVVGGLVIGWLLGTGVGRLMVFLRQQFKQALGRDDFLAIGLIALTYGTAVLLHTYGFLAVLAAGLALRGMERNATEDYFEHKIVDAPSSNDAEEIATDPVKAPAYLTHAVLSFNEQLERLCELGIVLLIGGMFATRYLSWEVVWLVPLLFLVIRPISVVVSLFGTPQSGMERSLTAWFGIRGIGSLFYLTYVLERGVSVEIGQMLISVTLLVVASSIILHGISVTPLMKVYHRTKHATSTQI